MVIWRKKHIWSNQQGSNLRARHRWYVRYVFLYGLKQFPHAWFDQFSQVVSKFGLLRFVIDLPALVRNLL